MKLHFTFLLLCLAALAAAQNSCSQRYKQRTFSSIQIFRDVTYTQDAPKLIAASLGVETTIDKDLKMDIFMPPPTDTVTMRPAVIIAHGGGFVDVAFMGGTVLVGTMDNEDVQALADTLAHWGFVTASIEYRTGFDVLSGTSIKRAVWRGSQDMSAAIRFFRKNANWFGIDPNRVFIGGSSAGAFACLHSTFVDGSERIPESREQTPILMPDLGELHSRPVVQLSSFNPFSGNNVLADDVDSIAQGIASYWGAIADTDMLAGNNKAPLIMFHGTNDLIVDAECAQPFSSLILVAPVTCGSIVMDSAFTNLNHPHQTHIASGEGHEYWGALNGDWMPSGPNAYWPDMIQKTADFFHALMRPATPSITGPNAAAPASTHTYAIQNPIAGMRYCWTVTNGTIINTPNPFAATVQVVWSANAGLGSVRAIAMDRAEATSLQRIFNVNVSNLVAIDPQSPDARPLRAFPNPSNGTFSVELAGEAGDLRLMDTAGRLLLQQKISDGQQSTQLNADNLPKGLYILQYRTQKTVETQSISLY